MVNTFVFLVSLLALVMVASTILQYKMHRIPLGWTVFWSLTWTVGTLAFVFSGVADRVSNALFGRNASTVVIYGSIIVLLYLVFRLYISQKKQQAQFSELVEKLANEKLE